MTIQEQAKEAAGWFETSYRPNVESGSDGIDRQGGGTPYVRVREGAPEWVTDLCRIAHGQQGDSFGMLPDDWRYQFIREALDDMAETDNDTLMSDESEYGYNFADRLSVYNHELLAWLASHGQRASYCDEALEELGKDASDRGIISIIQIGQASEWREVYELVLGFLRERTEVTA